MNLPSEINIRPSEGQYLWLFFRVVPSVFKPVMCLESLNILKILRIRKIWAAFAMYSSEYLEDRRFRNTDT